MPLSGHFLQGMHREVDLGSVLEEGVIFYVLFSRRITYIELHSLAGIEGGDGLCLLPRERQAGE